MAWTRKFEDWIKIVKVNTKLNKRVTENMRTILEGLNEWQRRA